MGLPVSEFVYKGKKKLAHEDDDIKEEEEIPKEPDFAWDANDDSYDDIDYEEGEI